MAVSGSVGSVGPDLHAAVSAVIGRSESGPIGSVCGSVGAPRGGRSANQMSPLLLAHRTTPTLPIYSVLAVAALQLTGLWRDTTASSWEDARGEVVLSRWPNDKANS